MYVVVSKPLSFVDTFPCDVMYLWKFGCYSTYHTLAEQSCKLKMYYSPMSLQEHLVMPLCVTPTVHIYY